MYVAMGVDDVETLLLPDEKPQPLTPLQEHRKLFMNKKLEPVKEMNHQAHLQAHLAFLKHPALQGNFEFASNLIQDIMGHISFIAQMQAEKTQGDVQALEAQLFLELLPAITPPQGQDPTLALQQQQIDDERHDKKVKNALKAAEIESKERIEDGKLEGDMIAADINERIEKAKNTVAKTNTNSGNQSK
jgi:hypothetical protein